MSRSALVSALSFVVACSSATGGEGQPCACTDCSLLSGTFTCDTGLVCNQGGSSYTCQAPGTTPSGGACSADVDCTTGLACIALRCGQKLGQGAPCSGAPGECADGLTCTKTCGTAECIPAGSTNPCPDGGM